MAYPRKTVESIITGFELQVNDVTELSSTEELSILNRVYIKICVSRPWLFSIKASAGSISQDATGYYITKPDGFYSFIEDANFTQNNTSYQGNTNPKVIFVGTDLTPYTIVNYMDRRQYRDKAGYAYLDLTADKIYFTGTPAQMTYEFDYVSVPELLTLTDYPIFPGQFHDMLEYAMAVENDILQLSEKARSYQKENQEKLDENYTNMAYWNAMQYQN